VSVLPPPVLNSAIAYGAYRQCPPRERTVLRRENCEAAAAAAAASDAAAEEAEEAIGWKAATGITGVVVADVEARSERVRPLGRSGEVADGRP
jgi:hypothetical protein